MYRWLVFLFVALVSAVNADVNADVKVTEEDIKKAKKQLEEEKKFQDRSNVKRVNPKYDEVTDQKILKKLNKKAETPPGTVWLKERNKNRYTTGEDLYKHTKEYRNATDAQKKEIDNTVKKHKFILDYSNSKLDESNNKEKDKVDSTSNSSPAIERYEKKLINERAKKIAKDREKQEVLERAVEEAEKERKSAEKSFKDELKRVTYKVEADEEHASSNNTKDTPTVLSDSERQEALEMATQEAEKELKSAEKSFKDELKKVTDKDNNKQEMPTVQPVSPATLVPSGELVAPISPSNIETKVEPIESFLEKNPGIKGRVRVGDQEPILNQDQ
ncbi:MAG: hypothetical protein KUF75_13225 [Candidatus Thiodiazotropha sp. (ex Ctena orbiculata)]|nr:hypothetical protein [Candidatus Thiodiazotropha taylori]